MHHGHNYFSRVFVLHQYEMNMKGGTQDNWFIVYSKN